MDEETARIQRKIERCRHLANLMVDDDARRAMEELAAEYEARLRERPEIIIHLPGPRQG
jgi:hypothetical protein